MGVIQRQGFKASVVSYFGVAIGALSTMFVYPKALEILGIYRTMFDIAVLIGIVVMMGSSVSAIRFFPKYEDKSSGHKGFLTWLLSISAVGFLLFLLAFPFIQKIIGDNIFNGYDSQYRGLIFYLIPLTFSLALLNILSRYISNLRRVTVPAIFEQITIKITLPLLILLFLANYLTVHGVFIGIVASFAFGAFALILYLKHLGEWKLTRPVIWSDRDGLKEYAKYSWFGLLSGVGSQVAFKIDSVMITSLLQAQSTGINTIAFALSEIIIKPMRSMSSIAGPVVAHHLEHGNLQEVKSIYRKSSLNMTIIGIGLFFLIWTVLHNLFNLMENPEVMRQGTYLFFFLGLAQVWDMMTGVNSEIISYSKHYRVVLYLTLLLGVLNIGFNFWFIRSFGLTGSAMATCLSMFIFNLVKLIYIKIKYGFFPFTARIVLVIGFGVAAWLICKWMPVSGNDFADIFFKGFLFCVLYGVTIWKLNLSPEINHWIAFVLTRIKRVIMFSKSA